MLEEMKMRLILKMSCLTLQLEILIFSFKNFITAHHVYKLQILELVRFKEFSRINPSVYALLMLLVGKSDRLNKVKHKL